MLTTAVAGFDAVLKEVYLGPIRSQLNSKTVMLDAFTKGDVKKYQWEGKEVVIPLRNSRNYTGVLATAEGGQLPTPGFQGYIDLKVPMRFIHGRIQLTAQVMKASRSNKGAFAQAMRTEQQGLVDDLSRQRNRMLCGYGAGTLALAASSTTSTSMALINPGGVAGTVNAARFIKAGNILAVYDTTGATLNFVDTVASITDANTIVFASSHTWVANAIVTLASANAGATAAGSFALEPMGILGIVDSTTYVSSIDGIDRSQAANAFFRSTILSSVGTISMDIIQRGIDNTEEFSGEVINGWFAHSSVRREILKLTDADRRYTDAFLKSPDPGTKAGLFKEDLPLVGLGVRVVKDFAYGTLIGVNKEHLHWLPETEGEWADDDGTVLFRVPNVDAYEARYRLFENFCSDKGNAHLRMDGITATVTSGVFSD